MATLVSTGRLRRPPPHLYFVGSAVFHYLGPSFAVLLFAVVPVAGVAWLRIVSAALVFAVWRRPGRILTHGDSDTRRLVIGLGVVFAVMNYSFYLAIDALPLGTVAAIEFVGPIVLALAGRRSTRNVAAVVLAACGVWLLTDVRLAGSAARFAWAFLNAGLFTAYIVLAHRLAGVATDTSPIDRLGASMIVAAIAITPLGIVSALPALTDLTALGAGIGVGVSSSVIPYVLDQFAMRQLPRETYALFVALLPATAVVVGLLVLNQVPTAIEAAGVALVVLAVATHQERPTYLPRPALDTPVTRPGHSAMSAPSIPASRWPGIEQ
jgi:inner membrane transporter RhtA